MTLHLAGDAAEILGLRQWRFDRLRRQGMIPEAIRVGRIHAIPADAIGSIRERLIAAGVLSPLAQEPMPATPGVA